MDKWNGIVTGGVRNNRGMARRLWPKTSDLAFSDIHLFYLGNKTKTKAAAPGEYLT